MRGFPPPVPVGLSPSAPRTYRTRGAKWSADHAAVSVGRAPSSPRHLTAHRQPPAWHHVRLRAGTSADNPARHQVGRLRSRLPESDAHTRYSRPGVAPIRAVWNAGSQNTCASCPSYRFRIGGPCRIVARGGGVGGGTQIGQPAHQGRWNSSNQISSRRAAGGGSPSPCGLPAIPIAICVQHELLPPVLNATHPFGASAWARRAQ